MLDLIMGHEVESGHCLSKQQNKCRKPKTEFCALHWSLRSSYKTTFI